MARQDQMKALYEFFGGTPGTLHSTSSSVFSQLKGVFQGEPIEKMQSQMPMVYMTAPTSTETREMAQYKFITYPLAAVLLWQTPGVSAGSGDRGASILNEFYGFLDAIAAQIRENKELVTASYPLGASFKFGEKFSIRETHSIEKTTLIAVARIDIESVEQVHA